MLLYCTCTCILQVSEKRADSFVQNCARIYIKMEKKRVLVDSKHSQRKVVKKTRDRWIIHPSHHLLARHREIQNCCCF